MEILIGDIKSKEEMNQSVSTSINEQHKKGLEGMLRWKEAKMPYGEGRLYDAVSTCGDTLSISEAGKAANSGKGNRLGKCTADGIVIQKETDMS